MIEREAHSGDSCRSIEALRQARVSGNKPFGVNFMNSEGYDVFESGNIEILALHHTGHAASAYAGGWL